MSDRQKRGKGIAIRIAPAHKPMIVHHLLIAVAPDRLSLLLGALQARSVQVRAVIGRVETAAREGYIAVA